ncbi:MAG: type II toxin-antitoxin system TacA family antitoxin, partial [Planctomycetota bacterium]
MATKTVRIEVRLSPEHKTLIENAAALHGQSLSAFVVS